jgi:chemotaxis methyl-accepting protein methylase
MLEHLKNKINRLDKSIQNKIKLIQDNVLDINWPKGFDLIVLGCNCLYELPTPKTQKSVIEKSFNSLNPKGLLFIDNDNMEGFLDKSWCDI